MGAHDTQCLCGNQRTTGVSVSHFTLWVLGIVFEWPDTAASALPTGPSHQPLVSLGIKAKNEALEGPSASLRADYPRGHPRFET